jgi:hypothetical protein
MDKLCSFSGIYTWWGSAFLCKAIAKRQKKAPETTKSRGEISQQGVKIHVQGEHVSANANGSSEAYGVE